MASPSLAGYLKRTSSGLVLWYDTLGSHPFGTGDWVAGTGISLSLNGARFRFTVAAGADAITLDKGADASAGLLFTSFYSSGGGAMGAGLLVSAQPTASYTGIRDYTPIGFTGNQQLYDATGGSHTSIDLLGGVNATRSALQDHVLWADDTNAQFRDVTRGTTLSGAQVNNPHTGKGGIWCSSGGANTMECWKYVRCTGGYLTVTGLAENQVIKMYHQTGVLYKSATADAGGVAAIDLRLVRPTVDYTQGFLNVFDTDGTTLLANLLSNGNFFPGDEYEYFNLASRSIQDTGLTNAGFETGNLTGWTTDGSGSPTEPTVSSVQKRTGTYSVLLQSVITGLSPVYQDFAIPGAWEASIDAGTADVFSLAYFYNAGTGTDKGKLYFSFYDGTPGSLISATTSDLVSLSGAASVWTELGASATIPTLTRTIRIFFASSYTGLPYDLYMDDIEAFITIDAPPDTPTVTVTEVTANSCRLTGSAFVAGLGGGTHASTTYRIRKVSDDSLVYDETTSVVGELLTFSPIGPLDANTSYYGEMIYIDSDGLPSSAGQSANFTTSAQSGCSRSGIINHNDAGLTKIGVLSPDPYSYYLPLGNVLDGKMIAFYYGEVNRPRGLLLNECTPHIDAWATVKGGFDGQVATGYHGIYGYSWAQYWSIEFNGLGCWLLASGEYGSVADPLTGIFGYLRIGIPWPYGTCGVSTEPGESTPGTGKNSIEVDIWENNVKVHSDITWIPDSVWAANRTCSQFKEYGIRLQAVRDLIGDPTGDTWDIKCQYEEDAVPDGSTWSTEFAYTSEILTCGRGGAGFQLFPGASGGPSGAIHLTSMEVQNLSDFCEPPNGGTPGETQPTCVARANCGFISASASGWSGAAVGPVTEAKWDVRLTADDSLLYTTGWQSVYLEGFQVSLFDESAIPRGTSVYVQATLRDADATTSTITPGCTVTTGTPPNEPSVVINGFFTNRVIVTTGLFSSSDGTATHYQTTIGVYLATADRETEDPLVRETYTTPEQLTGQFSVEYDSFEVGVSHIVEVIYVDQYGCTSTALTTSAIAAPKTVVDKICPLYDECVVSGEGSFTTCALSGEAVWALDASEEATWDGTCIDNC